MTSRVIEDGIFSQRGPIPEGFMQRLAVKGGGTHLDDKLKEFSWDGNSPVAVPVISTEPGSGKVLGSRWAIRGPISTRTIKANQIWPDVDKDITVSWNFKGLTLYMILFYLMKWISVGEQFKFSHRGHDIPSNMSDWSEASADNLVTLRRGNTTISWADIATSSGDKNVCFRLEVQCVDVSTVVLYLTRIPLAHAQLIQLAERWEVEPHSDKIPVSTCLMGSTTRSRELVAKLMVKEPPDHKSGMGIYPLLEQVSLLVLFPDLIVSIYHRAS